jgi:hypothetical protein
MSGEATVTVEIGDAKLIVFDLLTAMVKWRTRAVFFVGVWCVLQAGR